MSDLAVRLRKRLEFSDDIARQESYRLDEELEKNYSEEFIDTFSFIAGARYQHALMLPLLEGLLKCVDALEKYADYESGADQGVTVSFQRGVRIARQTLAALERG